MILKMSKVQIVGPRRYFYDTLSVLHNEGVLHIEDVSKKITPGETLLRKMKVDDERLEREQLLDKLKQKVDAILRILEPSEISPQESEKYYQAYMGMSCEQIHEEVEKMLAEVEEQTKELAAKKTALEREYATYSRYEGILKKIGPLAKNLIALEGYTTVALLVDRKYKKVLDIIREEVGKITKNQYELVSTDVDENTTAALLVFNKIFGEQVNAFLYAEKVNQIRLPEELADKPFNEAYSYMRERIEVLPQEIGKVREELREVSKGWYTKLKTIRDVLEDRCEELRVASFAGETDYTFVIEGWVPAKYLRKLQKELAKKIGEKVILTEVPVSHEELEGAPVVMENPRWAKPFEEIVNMFGTPRYGTIDPTAMLALFYPLFFGFIIGDIGYGLVLLLICFLMRRKWGKIYFVRVATSMLSLAGIMAVFFGFLFGEFFGSLPEWYHWVKEVEIFGIHLPFYRIHEHNILTYAGIALAVGIAHLTLGFILGVINAYREKAKGHLLEKVGFLLLILSLFFILGETLKLIPGGGMIFFLLLIGGIALVAAGGGVEGVFHIPTLMSNIFSYIRLMALGVAGVILADVANQLATSFGSIWTGITIAIFLHLINIVFHTFSSTIHSLRLNVLEFFNKFYEPGGRVYKPFKRVGR